MLSYFANPRRFMRLSEAVLPWAAWLTVGLIGVGLYLALFVSPADYQHGDTVRIMYLHVPAAWMSLFCYTAMAGASAVALIWKHPLADVAAQSTAPVGACFALLTLVTGSLWGKPAWGTWWAWDPRLTSVLILFFLYLGYMALLHAFDDRARGARAAAILALVGVVNVPIIHYSVVVWSSLHQPASVIRAEGPAIDASMLPPLLLMALGYTTYYLWVLLVRVRGELVANKARILRLQQAENRV